MKKAKLYLAKRILCFLLVGCITSTSIFLSYGNTLVVKAETDEVALEQSIVNIIALVLGYLFPDKAVAITFVSSLVNEGIVISDYYSDNGDGTFTIDGKLFGIVETKLKTFGFVSSLYPSSAGTGAYEYDYCSYTLSYKKTDLTSDSSSKTYEHTRVVEFSCSSFSTRFPICGVFNAVNYEPDNSYPSAVNLYIYDISSIPSLKSHAENIYYTGSDYGNCTVNNSLVNRYSYTDDEFIEDSYNTFGYTNGALYYFENGSNTESSGYYSDIVFSNCLSFPIFSSTEDIVYAYLNGDCSKALNYAESSPYKGNNFVSRYNGGNFIVSADVINNIFSKLAEIEERLDDIDEKLEEINDYIEGKEEEEETETSDEDEEVEGSSWLEKIYNTLVKIYKKICSIRRWVIADTVIDGADLLLDILTEIGEMVVDLIVEPAVAFAYLASEISTLGSFLSKKFPFCIPWDVAFLLDFLKAEPKTPEFTLPLKIETYGIDEEIKISLEQFEIVSKISRIFLTLVFCRGLLDLSMKVVTVKQKEG